MVDTIKCESELDLTEDFYEKLLLGAIDKRLDRKKIEAHSSARGGHDTASPLSFRFKIPGKGKERQWSDDDTLVGPSSRWNSQRTKRTSTMRTLNESPVDDAGHTHAFDERQSNMTNFRHASPPSAGSGPPRRHTTFSDAIPEAEEPGPKTTKRSSTFGSHR